MKKHMLWFLTMFVSLTITAHAQRKPLNARIDSMLPAMPKSYLVDMAKVVKNEADVNQRLAEIRYNDTLNLVALTMPTLGEFEAADVAREAGRLWLVAQANDTIGSKFRNTGGVILLVMDSRKCRIEVATGSEGYLTDNAAANLCRDAAVDFKQGLYGDGILRIANGFRDAHIKGTTTAPSVVKAADDTDYVLWFIGLLGLGSMGVILVLRRNAARREQAIRDSLERYLEQEHIRKTTRVTPPTPAPIARVSKAKETYTKPRKTEEDTSYRRREEPDYTPSYTPSSFAPSDSSSSSDYSSGGSDSFSGGGGESSW